MERRMAVAGRTGAGTLMLAGLAGGALLFALLWPAFFAGKSLSHDDIALYQTALLFDPAYWFGTGYAEFFVRGGYHFIRPVSHLLMYGSQAAFGTEYGLYFLPYFLLLGLGAGAAAAIARGMGLPRWLAVSCGAAVLVQPAALGPGLLWITFQQDVLAGVFCLFAALACLHRLWGLAALALLVAVLTKEVALYAPLAAALWAILFAGAGTRTALLLLLPLGVWIAVRILATGSVTGDAYMVSGGIGGLIAGGMRGIAVWPTGFAQVGAIKTMVSELAALRTLPAGSLPAGLRAVLARDPATAAVLALNLALHLTVALAAIGVLWRHLRGRGRAAAPGPLAGGSLVLVFALGGLGLLVLQAYHLRFAGAFHPFLVLLLGWLAWQGRRASGMPVLGMLGAAMLAAFVAAGIVAAGQNLRDQRAEPEPAALEALAAAVRAEPPAPGTRILVVHGPVTGAAPRWLMAHWDRPEALVHLNQIHGCTQTPETPPPTVRRDTAGAVALDLTVPDCADLMLFWAEDPERLAEGGAARIIPAHDDLPAASVSYRMPQAHVLRGPAAGATADINWGRRLEATIPEGAFARILILDWESGAYGPLHPDG